MKIIDRKCFPRMLALLQIFSATYIQWDSVRKRWGGNVDNCLTPREIHRNQYLVILVKKKAGPLTTTWHHDSCRGINICSLELTKDTKVVTDVSPLSFDGSRHISPIQYLIDCRLHPSSIATPSINCPSLYHFVRRRTMPKNRTIKQTVE